MHISAVLLVCGVAVCVFGPMPPLVQAQVAVTFADTLRPVYRMMRNFLFDNFGRTDNQWAYNWNLKRGKVQKPFPETQPFFCDANGPGARTRNGPPQSVHRLRPGDIDVIGAIGDSLTAGNGALATNLNQLLIENKGVSWSIGGQATWHKFLTLPNILKVFNPELYGYSLSDGYSIQKSARFNTAEIGAMSRDIPHEARILVKRMHSDPKVNVTEQWKLITIMIGSNDFCLDMCYLDDPARSARSHERDLTLALRTLRDNLPRLLVNVVPPPSMSIIVDMPGKPMDCMSSHYIECPCMFSYQFVDRRKAFYAIMQRWQETVERIARAPEFNGREDFAVVAQPFLKELKFPRTESGSADFTYMSLDCFHLSQKGYARASNALWNNMLEPVGNKTTTWYREFSRFNCPTVEHPYIFTNQNSVS